MQGLHENVQEVATALKQSPFRQRTSTPLTFAALAVPQTTVYSPHFTAHERRHDSKSSTASATKPARVDVPPDRESRTFSLRFVPGYCTNPPHHSSSLIPTSPPCVCVCAGRWGLGSGGEGTASLVLTEDHGLGAEKRRSRVAGAEDPQVTSIIISTITIPP